MQFGDKTQQHTSISLSLLLDRPPCQNQQNFCIILYGIYVLTQHINISIDQELMCFIPFHSFLIFLDLPDGIF
jgi:hypothetical protein